MSTLAVGQGLEDLELWLTGLFTAAELAAAELLLQLSLAAGDDGKAASTSTTPSYSPRWVSPSRKDLTEGEEEVEERVFEETAVSTELDRRATKRCRRLSELYAATSQVTSVSPAKKKHKGYHHHEGSSHSSVEEATRYGGHYKTERAV